MSKWKWKEITSPHYGKTWNAKFVGETPWVTIIDNYGVFLVYVMGQICEGAEGDENPHEDFTTLAQAKDWIESNWDNLG